MVKLHFGVTQSLKFQSKINFFGKTSHKRKRLTSIGGDRIWLEEGGGTIWKGKFWNRRVGSRNCEEGSRSSLGEEGHKATLSKDNGGIANKCGLMHITLPFTWQEPAEGINADK